MRNVGLTLIYSSSPPAVWPAAPIPAELYRRHEAGAAPEVIADAIKLAEESVQDGNRPQVDSELVVAAPVPTLVDVSKEAHMMVVGCRGQDALQRTMLGSVSTGLAQPTAQLR